MLLFILPRHTRLLHACLLYVYLLKACWFVYTELETTKVDLKWVFGWLHLYNNTKTSYYFTFDSCHFSHHFFPTIHCLVCVHVPKRASLSYWHLLPKTKDLSVSVQVDLYQNIRALFISQEKFWLRFVMTAVCCNIPKGVPADLCEFMPVCVCPQT